MIDVALDARMGRQLSVGMRTYARELVARLPRIAPDLRFTVWSRGAHLGFAEQVALPLTIAREKPRLVHFLSIYAPLVVPAPYVVTIHDVIHLQFPQYFKRKVGLYYATAVRRLLRGAARIITDDERTVGELHERLQVDPRRCRVVALGVDDVYRDASVRPVERARPYVLYAGNHREHKNIVTLLDAWQRLPSETAVDILLTGEADIPEVTERFTRAKGGVEFLGDVPSHMLARYYAGARAYVHPALAEGFGLPMLEAMAVGTPVIASEECVPAILRPYCTVFAARDARALANAMGAALAGADDRSDALAGTHVARGLTWDRCAEQTAAVYREVL